MGNLSSGLERVKEAFRRGYDDVTRHGITMGQGLQSYRKSKNEARAYKEGYLAGVRKLALLAKKEIEEAKHAKSF